MRLRWILAASALVANLAYVALPQTAARSGRASIEGIVIMAGTGEPVAKAFVELSGTSNAEDLNDGRVLSFRAVTGPDGRFALSNLPAGGSYQLVVERPPDYVPAQYGQTAPGVPGKPIALAPDQLLRDIQIVMALGGTITGRTLDSEGKPIRNMPVELLRPWYFEGLRVLGATILDGKFNRAATAITDPRGAFVFTGLAPAQYYVRIRPVQGTDHLPTYYPSAVTDSEALPVNLRAGDRVTGIDVKVMRREERHVRGRVVDGRTGMSLEGTQVTLVERGAFPNAFGRTFSIRGDSFDLVTFRPGSYWLYAFGTIRNTVLRGRTAIEVANFDLKDVEIVAQPRFNVTGEFTIESDASAPINIEALERSSVVVRLQPTSPGTTLVQPVSVLLANRRFTLSDISPGDYRLEVFPVLSTPATVLIPIQLQNTFVKSIKLGGIDVLNGGFHLEQPPQGNLDIVISVNGGWIDGRVLSGKREAVSNTKVALVPSQQNRKRGDLYRSAFSDNAGRFQIKGIPPGSYKVFAFESVEEDAWHDPEFIKLFEDRGTPIEITENGWDSIDVTVIPAWN